MHVISWIDAKFKPSFDVHLRLDNKHGVQYLVFLLYLPIIFGVIVMYVFGSNVIIAAMIFMYSVVVWYLYTSIMRYLKSQLRELDAEIAIHDMELVKIRWQLATQNNLRDNYSDDDFDRLFSKDNN